MEHVKDSQKTHNGVQIILIDNTNQFQVIQICKEKIGLSYPKKPPNSDLRLHFSKYLSLEQPTISLVIARCNIK